MIGINKTEGMTNNMFKKYINNATCHLYPYMEDMPGKCVPLKVDISPGCNGKELLIKSQFRGLYVYPGLPNATSV